MKSEQSNSRRQFIKNTSIAALSLSLLPKTSIGKTQKTSETLACDQTTLDYYGVGPFYTANPPNKADGILAKPDEAGTRIIISGRVTNLDCSEFLANAVIDVWHANDAGEYDNSGYNLRGKFKTNNQGFYSFETIKPGKYLNGSEYRPSHIHFKITPEGKDTLITQLYFTGDSDIPGDAAASITSGPYDATNRIVPLVKNGDDVLEATWDIVIDGEGKTIGTGDLHLDKGVIYSAFPNPFSSSLEIKYGIFQDTKVGLSIYDIQGKEVAILEDRNLIADKYSAVWEPNKSLPNGIFYIALKVNDLQIQYIKVLRSR